MNNRLKKWRIKLRIYLKNRKKKKLGGQKEKY